MGHPQAKQKFEFETLHLDNASVESQYRQLENQIRNAISNKLLPTGARVPSSRALSQLLGISRNTVLAAYRQLISEGYLESEMGSGTRVSRLPPGAFEFTESKPSPETDVGLTECLSRAGRDLAKQLDWLPKTSTTAMPFRPHLAAIDDFPIDVWDRFANEQTKWTMRHLQHCDSQGYLPLRESIAQYMAISRGVTCTAEQVVVTSGAQQALQLVRQLLLEIDDTVWVEDPGNAPANQLLRLSGRTGCGRAIGR